MSKVLVYIEHAHGKVPKASAVAVAAAIVLVGFTGVLPDARIGDAPTRGGAAQEDLF